MSSVLLDAGINTKETSEMTIDIFIPKSEEQVVKYDSGCIEVLKKFNIERPKDSSTIDKTTKPKPKPVCHLDLDIFDCLYISDLIVITDYWNSQLLINSIDGHKNRTIPLKGQPRCMSKIKDYHIAVSYIKPIELASGKVGNIDIIDINNGLETTIENVWEVGCMTSQNELLFVVIDGRKINVMNMTGQFVRYIPCPSSHISNISSAENLLFLSDSGKNELFCCDLFGNRQWQFKDDRMKMPSSIIVDPNHNVYVTCDRSENVVIVSPRESGLRNFYKKTSMFYFPL
ncbi:unnamed protein product [Mytilus edulis]|uniref:Uncharacterized protein n=1 Tax=Mytilus edulis TaxID=6550 RepID=A0A8S3RM79_MYTED|nr:unnamed protein product [Mytilus edulis]